MRSAFVYVIGFVVTDGHVLSDYIVWLAARFVLFADYLLVAETLSSTWFGGGVS